MTRAEPPLQGSEKAMLVGWLDFHRDTLATKCEGLSAEQLSCCPVSPSTLSLADEGSSGLPLRFWLVKTLNEYARHNGHADLLRECIDGTVGE